jgi:hypothetical protein
MKSRRIMLWALSVGFGIAATAGTIFAFGSSYDRFWTNFLFKGDLPLLLAAGYGSLAFIWLDWILRTDYLRN